jgi:dipeptidyl aminopeptidase/acylaminoacyl peptidase
MKNADAPFELSGDIRCPVYGFFGDLDTNPSPADVDRFETELKRYNIPYVFHRYPKAGHGFQNPARSKGRKPTRSPPRMRPGRRCWP